MSRRYFHKAAQLVISVVEESEGVWGFKSDSGTPVAIMGVPSPFPTRDEAQAALDGYASSNRHMMKAV